MNLMRLTRDFLQLREEDFVLVDVFCPVVPWEAAVEELRSGSVV